MAASTASGQKPVPAGPAPQSSRSNVGSQGLIDQIHSPDALQRSSDLWIPSHVARRFSYSIGSLSNTYEFDEDAIAVLGIDDSTRKNIEVVTNSFLAEIRELESQKLEIVEQSDQLIHLKIPADFAPRSGLEEYQIQVKEILGPVRADLFLRRFIYSLRDVTAAFTDSDRHIRISPAEKAGIKIQIQQNDHTAETGHSEITLKQWGEGMPDNLQHLVQAVEKRDSSN